MRPSEVNCLVTLLGLVEEIEECMRSSRCDVGEKIEEIRRSIIDRLVSEGINLLERITAGR